MRGNYVEHIDQTVHCSFHLQASVCCNALFLTIMSGLRCLRLLGLCSFALHVQTLLHQTCVWLRNQSLPLYMQVQFTGMTPLGSSLDSKVIRPFLGGGISNRNLQKPILVITITDGEPTGEPQNTVANVIKNAKNMCASSIYGPNAIAFEFAQVGKDTKAQAFLGRLDTDPEIGKMIDATSYYELEAEEYMRRGVNLTPELWLVKLMVGAVDPTYDEQVSCRPARE